MADFGARPPEKKNRDQEKGQVETVYCNCSTVKNKSNGTSTLVVSEMCASAILHNDDFRSDSARLTIVRSGIYSQFRIYLWSDGVSIAKFSAPLSAKVVRFRDFHIPCNSIKRIRRRSNERDGPAHCGLVSQLNAGHYGG
jgi:hypothetical protein